MYCHICGKEISDQIKACPECGIAVPETRENRTRRDTEPIKEATVTPLIPKIEPRKPSPSDYPMKWYYFQIYAGLILNAIGSFISGLVYLFSGSIGFGLYMILIGVAALTTRSGLANFKKGAPIALTVFYITSYGTGVVVNAIQYAQLSDWVAESPIGTAYLISIVITFFIGLFMTICNATYFENRKDLFTN